jgi:tetratricopeptide (TPR) repeat protein
MDGRFTAGDLPRAAAGEPTDAPGSPSTLARLTAFTVGDIELQPALRRVRGPGGERTAEPRVMQVLVALADARGGVLTRGDLNAICWGGRIVGDDAMNRAVAEARRMLRETGSAVAIETVPRVGYRLIGLGAAALTRAAVPNGDGIANGAHADPANGSSAIGLGAERDGAGVANGSGHASPTFDLPTVDAVAVGAPHTPAEAMARVGGPLLLSRRNLVIGGAAAAVAGGSLWAALRGGADPRAEALIVEGRNALRDEVPARDTMGVDALKQAVELDPGNADAWGLLALAHRNEAEYAEAAAVSAAMRASEAAAARALALNPKQADARVALATLAPLFGGWLEIENRLAAALAEAPTHAVGLSHMTVLLQSVGRCRDSDRFGRRSSAADPLSPAHQWRLALKEWIALRIESADRVIDRALELWPRHPGVLNTRLMLFAFTGRPQLGAKLLDDPAQARAFTSPRMERWWRLTLRALETRRPSDIAVALGQAIAATPHNAYFATNGIMAASALGQLDAAFVMAEGMLLSRGPAAGAQALLSAEAPIPDQRRRKTMMLFVPATDAMRADRRFLGLCEGMGLVDYWKRRGVKADFLRG